LGYEGGRETCSSPLDRFFYTGVPISEVYDAACSEAFGFGWECRDEDITVVDRIGCLRLRIVQRAPIGARLARSASNEAPYE
jgi:hypothetical protein